MEVLTLWHREPGNGGPGVGVEEAAWSKSKVEPSLNPGNLHLRLAAVGSLPAAPSLLIS